MSASPDLGAPVVAIFGETGTEAPLVVLLHGRGSNEQDIVALAQHLPTGVAYAAVRAPIAEGGGFAWFANRGIGRPIASSLSQTSAWFRTWLDSVAPAGRPVILVGFSGGGAFAGGLVLADPGRFGGLAVLFATLPFDAGVPVEAGQLGHLPVFLAHGEQDQVIPTDLLARTWAYLLEESGAPVVARRSPGGHSVTAPIVADLGAWIAERLLYLRSQPTPLPGHTDGVVWSTLPDGVLVERRGPAPKVSWSIPQRQVTQNAPVDLQEQVLAAAQRLPGVTVSASHISVPGARALHLEDGTDDPQAYLVPSAREFAHLHPTQDGSLHLALPAAHAADLVARGWGRTHPLAGTRLSPGFVMLFGPRDAEELETVTSVVAMSHAYAAGGLLADTVTTHSSPALTGSRTA